MALQFRNVDATPSDPVASWPYEAVVTAIDRGLVADWQSLFAEIRRSPWGPTARRVARYLTYREPDGVGRLFALAIERARSDTEASEREAVARRIREAVAASGLSGSRFADLVGTSASRLSTYTAGKVTPSAAMLVRIERAADETATAK